MRSNHSPVHILRDSLLVQTMMSMGGIGQETAIVDQAEGSEESLAGRYNETVDLVGVV